MLPAIDEFMKAQPKPAHYTVTRAQTSSDAYFAVPVLKISCNQFATPAGLRLKCGRRRLCEQSYICVLKPWRDSEIVESRVAPGFIHIQKTTVN